MPIPSLETTPPVDGDLQRLDTLFVEQARRTPGAVAIMRKGEATTYRALGQLSNRFANTLKANGLEARDLIAPISSRLVAGRAAMKVKHAQIQPIIDQMKAAVERQRDAQK